MRKSNTKRNQKIALFSPLLIPLSFLYWLVVEIRNFLFCHQLLLKTAKLNCFLISIGNITAGGTGKTPITIFLAKQLLKKEREIAVIARGYKKKGNGFLVSNKREILLEPGESGDEAGLLAKNLSGIPILIGRNRKELTKIALNNFKADTIILDDAFHYRYLKKDCEIVVLDSTNPFSNKRLLPAGLLREPLSSLKYADCFWLNHINLVDQEKLDGLKKSLKEINPGANVVESFYQPVSLVDSSGKVSEISAIFGKEVWLLAGIGNPSTFENLVKDLGVKIKGKSFFHDHHWYKNRDLKKISRKDFDILLTTEKDLIKLKELVFPKPILALRIEVKIKDEEKLWEVLKI